MPLRATKQHKGKSRDLSLCIYTFLYFKSRRKRRRIRRVAHLRPTLYSATTFIYLAVISYRLKVFCSSDHLLASDICQLWCGLANKQVEYSSRRTRDLIPKLRCITQLSNFNQQALVCRRGNQAASLRKFIYFAHNLLGYNSEARER